MRSRTSRFLLLMMLVLAVAVAVPSPAQAQSATPTYCWGGFTADTSMDGYLLVFMFNLIVTLWY